MNKERTTYADTILVEKTVQDSCGIVSYRLSEGKIVNEQFGCLFYEISSLKRDYNLKLRKLIAENEHFKKNIGNRMITKKIVGSSDSELANLSGLDSLGSQIPALYDNIIDVLKTELQNNLETIKLCDNKIVPSIQSFNQNDTQLKETEKLLQNFMENSPKGSTWESTGPLLFQMFETCDFERLQFVQKILLDYGMLLQKNQSMDAGVVNKNIQDLKRFDSEKEIHQFTDKVMNHKFEFDTLVTAKDVPAQANNGISEKKLRHTSSATVLKNELMNNGFTGSSKKKQESPHEESTAKKSTNKLKSKFGSVFGRKKDKKQATSNAVEPSKGKHSAAYSSFTSASPPKSPDLHGGYEPWKARQPAGMQSQQSNSARTTRASTIVTIDENKPLASEPVATEQYATVSAPLHAEKELPPIKEQQPQQEKSYQPQPQAQQPQAQQPQQPQQPQTQPQQPQYQQPQYQQPQYQHEQLQQQPQPQQYQQPQQFQTTSDGYDNSQVAYEKAPPPPPSRKQTGRVQSQMFHDMDVSSVDRHQSMLMPNMTGELMSTLDPQVTGGTASLDVSPGFQHTNESAIGSATGTAHSSGSGLKCSVAEVINCTYVSGALTKLDVIGEVALNYDKLEQPQQAGNLLLNLHSDKFQPEKLITNKAFMEKVSLSGTTAQGFNEFYKIDPQFILSKTLGAIKYSVSDISNYVPPVSLQPVWKFENHQASMVLTIKPNVVPLVLNNFQVLVSIDDCESTTALSKPQGSFNKEKNRIAWRFSKEPVVFHDLLKDELKLVARFMTTKMGKESKCHVKFNTANYSEKVFDFQFKESDSEWESLPTMNTLVSGQYTGFA